MSQSRHRKGRVQYIEMRLNLNLIEIVIDFILINFSNQAANDIQEVIEASAPSVVAVAAIDNTAKQQSNH